MKNVSLTGKGGEKRGGKAPFFSGKGEKKGKRCEKKKAHPRSLMRVKKSLLNLKKGKKKTTKKKRTYSISAVKEKKKKLNSYRKERRK